MHKKYLEVQYNSFKKNSEFYKRSVIFNYWRAQKNATWRNHYDELPSIGVWKSLIYASISVNRLCLGNIGNFRSNEL